MARFEELYRSDATDAARATLRGSQLRRSSPVDTPGARMTKVRLKTKNLVLTLRSPEEVRAWMDRLDAAVKKQLSAE